MDSSGSRGAAEWVHGQESGEESVEMLNHPGKPHACSVRQVAALLSLRCPCPVRTGVDERLAPDNETCAEVIPVADNTSLWSSKTKSLGSFVSAAEPMLMDIV